MALAGHTKDQANHHWGFIFIFPGLQAPPARRHLESWEGLPGALGAFVKEHS